MTRSRFARSWALSVSLLVLATASPVLAEDAAAEDESIFSGVVQLDFTNAYFFRGIRQEREGTIFQPWAEVYAKLYSADDGFLRGVSLGAGIWNSFHSERTGAVNSPQWLYETDLYPLISLQFAGGVSLTTVYYLYTSPNAAFSNTQELNFKLAWDDSDAFGAWSMKPWINFAIETYNTSFGPHSGQGVQMGIAPTLYASDAERYAVTVTAPAELGLAINRYYENAGGGENTYGYGSLGLLVSLPLSFMPEAAGAWTLSAGGKYYAFSETLENANGGRSTYPVGTLSLGVAF